MGLVVYTMYTSKWKKNNNIRAHRILNSMPWRSTNGNNSYKKAKNNSNE
jgi:hypothetical protein